MQKRRFDELEGLRGFAAIMVVVYHFLQAFYLLMVNGPASGGVQHMRFEDDLYGTPFLMPFSGTLMVAIFFVLSGFVLSIGFFQSKKTSVVRKLAAKRYLRLMIPALAATLVAFALSSLIFFKQGVFDINGSPWIDRRWGDDLSLLGAIKSGMFGIFVIDDSKYNVVLWTMMYEFAGSFIVFGFLLLFGKTNNRWLAYLFLIIATANTWYLPFILGVMLADGYASGLIKPGSYSKRLIVPLVVLAVFLGGFPLGGTQGTMYAAISPELLNINWVKFYLTIAATLIVGLVVFWRPLSELFKKPIISGVGKYTFALYLTHLPILLTVTMALFLLLNGPVGLSYNLSAIGAFALTIPVFVEAAVLFEKYVDAPAVRLSSNVAAIFLGEKPMPKVKGRLTGVIFNNLTNLIRK